MKLRYNMLLNKKKWCEWSAQISCENIVDNITLLNCLSKKKKKT